MNDKIITHEDLPTLKSVRGTWDGAEEGRAAAELLDRLIAAVEADKPALSEGWVLVDDADGTHVRWYDGSDGISSRRGGPTSTSLRQWTSVTPLATAASLIPEHWTLDRKPGLHGDPVIWAESDVVLRKSLGYEAAFEALAGLVLAAQAERGQS